MKFKKILLILTSLFIFNNVIYADSSIDITKRLYGVDNPNNTFTYNITPRETNPEVINFNPDSFTISFDENSTIISENTDEIYTLDFSNINFTVPGKYEYVVREVSSSNESLYPIDSNYYVIALNVINELDDNNTPTGNLIADVLQSAFYNGDSGKSEIVFETRPLTYITLKKNVTGDLGNINEYFKFKIIIEDGDGYTINGQDSVVSYNKESINTINTYDSSVDNYVYLKHGQTVTIGLNNGSYEIPSDVSFTIEEMDATNYKTYINGSIQNNKLSLYHTLNTPSSNIVKYVNNNESTVLTGLFVNIIPFVILIIVSIIGIYAISKKNKNTSNN